MYETHYGLSRKPFEISPDPDFLWFGEKHREGLAILKYGILENKGFLLITGEVGTGKTALIRAIEKEVQARAIIVTIPDPGMSLMDFFNFMASELKMDRSFKNKGDFLVQFKKLMLEAFSSYRRVLLIIDESQRLNHELLEEIRLLSNIDLAGKVLINIFFVGQSEFRQILAREENRAVRQRITVSYHLPPLTEEETGHYIRHRLKVAGASHEIFTPDALRTVYRYASGLPRLTNIVCDHALMSGYVRGLNQIDGDVVIECGGDLKITIGERSPTEKAPPAASQAAKQAARPPAPARDSQPHPARSVMIFAAFLALLGAGWYFWGDTISDQLARWGKGKAALETQGPTGAESTGRRGGAPPLPVETGPREPKPAETSGEAAKAPIPPAPGPAAAAARKPETKEPPTAPGPVKAEPKTVAPPPVTAAPPVARPAPPASPPVAAAPSAPVPFQLKEFTVYFAQNSAEISAAAKEVLAKTAALLKGNPRTAGVIEGHTDSTGDEGYNKLVAENRAASVRNYLITRGVDPSRLSIASFGSEKPIDTNDTQEGRGRNRRAVIRIVSAKQG
jgi:general secretion pathway protein A